MEETQLRGFFKFLRIVVELVGGLLAGWVGYVYSHQSGQGPPGMFVILGFFAGVLGVIYFFAYWDKSP